jgi:long-chain acyl-CoA synthetase
MTLLPTRFLPLTEFISRNAEWYPEKTAIVFEGERLTWRDLDHRINKVSSHLARAGISKGDRVAILSQNCLEYPEIMFGALKAGAVVVPLSTMVQRETVLLQLRDAEPKAIFVAHAHLPLVEGSQPLGDPIVFAGQAEGWRRYEDIQQGGSDAEAAAVLSAEDSYNIVYSSGTTGIPKGIVHTHQARVYLALTCGLEFRVHNEAVSLVSTPIYANGTQLIYLPTIMAGGTLVLMRAFDPLGFLKLVQQEKCTHAFMVPTQFIRIMEHPQFSRYDTSSIEILLSAAAPLWKETKNEILNKFPKAKLAELYGITEGISTVLRPNEQFSKPGSVGKPRLGGDIKILDTRGAELPRGEIGEIAGSNFSMMAGYYRSPDKTRDVLWHDREGRTYIKTGDIGKLDSDGYLYILDRKKDLIVSGGINIFPSDLERVLRVHPEVAEAAVIGVPHREWGESPLALVVKRDPVSPLSENDLKDWANARLAGYQKLIAVEFRRSLSKNDLQKVLKNELRKPYWESFKAATDAKAPQE